MNTLTTKYRNQAIALGVLATSIAAAPIHAEESVTVRAHASKQENIGVVTGLAVGAAAGGPIGAIVGAAAGAWIGDRYHKQASARAALAGNVTELNGSLAQEQARGEKLDLALSYTNEVQIDVSFRTNDDSVPTQALPPLLKIGALAAALADARLRVSGFADPRGAQTYNDELSKRRAAAVAAVLSSAGVPPERLIVEGNGSADSTSAAGDLDGFAFDRRVSVRIERPVPSAVARND
jgi:outer membrane protein OmpA-like peptidoglycan-associated protein